MMILIPSLREFVLLRRESWDHTMRDRVNRANESPCQPQLTPYEIHGVPQGLVRYLLASNRVSACQSTK